MAGLNCLLMGFYGLCPLEGNYPDKLFVSLQAFFISGSEKCDTDGTRGSKQRKNNVIHLLHSLKMIVHEN